MIAAGYDSDRRPLVDVNRAKAACLDVRFATLKNDLLDMTGSALGLVVVGGVILGLGVYFPMHNMMF